jgi:hypothetical protein
MKSNPTLNRTLRDKAAQHRLAPRWASKNGDVMRAALYRTCIAGSLLIVAGCDQSPQLSPKPSHPTYAGCLQSAVAGSSSLSVEEIRSLCAEATGVVDAHYKFQDGEMVPSNDFTRCYDAQKKSFEAQKVPDATRLAKLSCKYPDIK